MVNFHQGNKKELSNAYLRTTRHRWALNILLYRGDRSVDTVDHKANLMYRAAADEQYILRKTQCPERHLEGLLQNLSGARKKSNNNKTKKNKFKMTKHENHRERTI